MSSWVASEVLPEDGVEVLVMLSLVGQEACQCSYVVAVNNYCDGENLWMTQIGWLKNEWVERWMLIKRPSDD